MVFVAAEEAGAGFFGVGRWTRHPTAVYVNKYPLCGMMTDLMDDFGDCFYLVVLNEFVDCFLIGTTGGQLTVLDFPRAKVDGDSSPF